MTVSFIKFSPLSSITSFDIAVRWQIIRKSHFSV